MSTTIIETIDSSRGTIIPGDYDSTTENILSTVSRHYAYDTINLLKLDSQTIIGSFNLIEDGKVLTYKITMPIRGRVIHIQKDKSKDISVYSIKTHSFVKNL